MRTKKIISQDNVGKVFGRLTVLREFTRPIRTIPNKKERMWEYQCICGTVKTARATSIKQGLIRSCGCLWRDTVRTHNKANTPEYRIWAGVIQRTENTNNPAFKNYGGREDAPIAICQRWRTSFENFLADMGKRPSRKHTIERRNNDGIYEPNNCYWATRNVQNRNNRHNRFVTFNGETLCLKEWAQRIGVGAKTLSYRLKRWPIEVALTTPRLQGQKLISRSSHQLKESIHKP